MTPWPQEISGACGKAGQDASSFWMGEGVWPRLARTCDSPTSASQVQGHRPVPSGTPGKVPLDCPCFLGDRTVEDSGCRMADLGSERTSFSFLHFSGNGSHRPSLECVWLGRKGWGPLPWVESASRPSPCARTQRPVREGRGLTSQAGGRAQAPGTACGWRAAQARTHLRTNVFTKGKPSPLSTMD